MKRWISNTFLTFVTSIFAITLTLDHADAKRLGGGRSIGKQSSTVQQRQTAEPTQTTPARQQTAQNTNSPTTNPATAPASTRSKWLAPLAGLAAGLGIAALLSHFGLGETFSSIVMAVLLIGVAILVISLLMRRFRKNTGYAPRYEPAYQYTGLGRETVSGEPEVKQSTNFQSAQSAGGSSASSTVARQGVPADFDTETFVRNAKVYFVRLQAAFDACNTNDLREFTSPEMFAELSLQLSERGNAKQQTDVVTLQGEVLCVENQTHEQLASVRFTGMLREEAQQAAQPFDEVWNFTKPLNNATGWVLAGIQQLS